MPEQQITICNKLGLHARAAARFVQVASGYASHIELRHDHRKVNGKSIMGIMMLAASQGTPLTLFTEGEDADEAMDALVTLVNSKFGEPE